MSSIGAFDNPFSGGFSISDFMLLLWQWYDAIFIYKKYRTDVYLFPLNVSAKITFLLIFHFLGISWSLNEKTKIIETCLFRVRPLQRNLFGLENNEKGLNQLKTDWNKKTRWFLCYRWSTTAKAFTGHKHGPNYVHLRNRPILKNNNIIMQKVNIYNRIFTNCLNKGF